MANVQMVSHVLPRTMLLLIVSLPDPFLRKTHHPDLSSYATNDVMGDQYWRQFDRAVHLIRNPLDEVFSYWNYRQTHDHEVGHDPL